MCPMKIKIKIANFSRVVKLIFGPLKKKNLAITQEFFSIVGHVIPRWNGLDEYNTKP